ncbi:MAG: hypothetical protein MAG551_02761 [Candidatus Scalindua arabica]|uniref:DUF7718 domain-containing protein n=1 Tax=Candidatus Scalindua arabica TaxID=1127984 RepID=A0A941W695_9BACT|nr:hypothetical protein [Candidatus Scalindua arabica]
MSEKTYTRDLGEGVRKRHYHRTEKGKVIDFVVQLEVILEGKWKPVIRYDCSHNFAHIDRYNIRGEKVKEDIYLTYEDSLTLADEDININWEYYKEKFLKGEYS